MSQSHMDPLIPTDSTQAPSLPVSADLCSSAIGTLGSSTKEL